MNLVYFQLVLGLRRFRLLISGNGLSLCLSIFLHGPSFCYTYHFLERFHPLRSKLLLLLCRHLFHELADLGERFEVAFGTIYHLAGDPIIRLPDADRRLAVLTTAETREGGIGRGRAGGGRAALVFKHNRKTIDPWGGGG